MQINIENMALNLHWPTDKNKLCRTCTAFVKEPSTAQNSLFFINKPTKLFTLFHDFLIMPEISPNDGLPNLLCKHCQKQLQSCMTFKEQCLQANKTLKQLFSVEGTSNESKIETSQLENGMIFKCGDNSDQTYCDFNKHIPLYNNDNSLAEVYVQTREDNSLTTDEDKPEIKSVIEIDEILIKSEYDDEQQLIICDDQKNGTQYQCNICNRLLESKLKFTIHFMQHVVLAGAPKEHFYFCKNCGELFRSNLELEKHSVKEHINKTAVLWMCSQCQETFDSESHLFKHETDEEHYNLLDQSSDDIFTCPMCSKSCTSKSELISHSVVHLLQNYQCKRCSKVFITQESHNCHMNSHPGNGFFCEICNEHLLDKNSLYKHIELVHKSTSPYACRFCNRRFKVPCDTKVHERTHNAGKRFMCDSCGYGTNNSGDLKIHMRIHTAERPYKCTYANCSKTFKTNSHRAAHVRCCHLDIRTVQCQICSKSFSRGNSLKKHMLVHSDDKPYKCAACKFATKTKYHLSLHMKQHNKS